MSTTYTDQQSLEQHTLLGKCYPSGQNKTVHELPTMTIQGVGFMPDEMW